jgi:hypothetical protein
MGAHRSEFDCVHFIPGSAGTGCWFGFADAHLRLRRSYVGLRLSDGGRPHCCLRREYNWRGCELFRRGRRNSASLGRGNNMNSPNDHDGCRCCRCCRVGRACTGVLVRDGSFGKGQRRDHSECHRCCHACAYDARRARRMGFSSTGLRLRFSGSRFCSGRLVRRADGFCPVSPVSPVSHRRIHLRVLLRVLRRIHPRVVLCVLLRAFVISFCLSSVERRA